MLTAALAAGKSTIETAYDIEELAEELDFIHIMAYDYHGKWDGRTGHNAPLYAREDEPDDEKSLNVVSMCISLTDNLHLLSLFMNLTW